MQMSKRSAQEMALPPSKKIKKSADSVFPSNPTKFVEHAFQANGFSLDKVIDEARSQLPEITPTMIEAYGMEVSKAVRDNDLDTLKELHSAGVLLDCCNKFGDSLIHIACRRSHTQIVRFLLEEAKVCVLRMDDLKRTPLHDACWTAEPNFEIVDMLLRAAPVQAVCKDNRGFAPFEYARQHHEEQWLEFLSERRSLLVLPNQQ